MIIGNIHGIYELSHKLPNNLRLGILGNKENLKTSLNYSLVLSYSAHYSHNENVKTTKKLLKNRN